MKFLSNILAKAGLIVDGTVTLNSVANASTDTDRFIVIDNGVVKYRTGSQLRSDIDAASAAAGLPVGGAAGQILAKIDGTNYNTEWIDNYTTDLRQTVKAGEAINKGQAVYISGADGTNVVVSKASNTSDATSSKTLGLLAQNLSTNGQGFVITEGKLTGINTSTAQAGDPVWLGTNGNLLFGVANKPSAPAHLVYLGVVTRANQNNGEIFVHVVNGFELEELHDVQIQSYIDKGVLYRDVATDLWKHATISTILGYTPVNPNRTLTINGTAHDLSADRTWTVGDVRTDGTYSNPSWITALAWSKITNTPTTLAGYGITDAVPSSRTITINGTALDLSANRSWSVGTVTSVGLTSATSGVTITDSPVTVSGTIGIAIATANGSQQGLLSGTDWTTFNNKQNALTLTTTGTSGAASLIGATLNVPQYQAQGNYITSLTGEATASGPGAASVTLSTTAVTGKLLTGLNLSGGGTIAATDSILQAFGKVQNQISAMVGGVMYQGTWNASTNTPTLTSSVGVKGYYYIVDVSGTTSLNGISDWRVGDWAIFNGSTWDKVDNTDAVSSVNGFTGAVSLTTSHIAEGTNLYYLDSRSRTAISLTTTGNSGAATYDNVSGIINVPQYTLAGLGGVPTTRQLTINGTAFDLSADRSWSVGTVTSVGLNSTTSGITITNTPVTGSGALTINIATASGSQQGLLSSSDWTTFNNKQNALTNPVTGTGTTGQVAYFNGTTSITGESNLFWDASNDRLGIGINTPSVIQHLYAGLSGSALFYTRYTSVDGADIRFGKNFGATDTNNAILGTWSNNAIDFYTNSTLAARLDASGRLGIGVAAPTVALDVVGAGRFTGDLTVVNSSSPSIFINNQSANGRNYRLVSKDDGLFVVQRTGIADLLLLNDSGNLGLGVTPSAWSTGKAIELNALGNSLWSYGQDNIYLTSNAYFNAGWKYGGSGMASNYTQFQGAHIWEIAGSGTAGNAITFTQAMTLQSTGNLLVGTTSTFSGVRMVVEGGSGQVAAWFRALNDAVPVSVINDGTSVSTIGFKGSTTANAFNVRVGADGENLVAYTSNTERMRITSGGNVGIGTANATGQSADNRALQIYGAGFANRAQIHFVNSNTGEATGDGTFIGIDSSTNFYINNAESAATIFENGGSERMRITSAGNVGIGESNPASYRLQVKGPDGQGIQYEDANGVRTLLGSFTSEAIVGTLTNHAVGFWANNSKKMTLTSSGNLGLGVTPSAWDNVFVKAIQIADNGGSISSFTTGNTSSKFTFLTNNAYYDNVGWKYATNGAVAQYRLVNDGHQWHIAPSGTAGNAISFTQAMTLDASGNLIVGGTNPTTKITLVRNGFLGSSTLGSATASTYSIDVRGNQSTDIVTGEWLGGYILDAYDSSSATGNGRTLLSGMHFVAAGDFSSSASSVALAFATGAGGNATERMRITSGGSLVVLGSNSSSTPFALGTSTPKFQLMNGGAYGLAGDVLTNGNSYLQSQRTDGNTAAYNLLLQPLGGNVLINTQSGTGRLVIAQDNAVQPAILLPTDESTIQGPTTNTQIRMGGNLVLGASSTMTFGTGGSERMRITSGGNVGIGSTTPNLLTWNRAVTINTATGNSALELSIGDAAQAYFAADASDIFLAAFANKNLKLRTNNADRMTITSGGNVGIGTTTPGATLDVNGTIRTADLYGGTPVPWKLGKAYVGAPPTPTLTIEVEINGSIYQIGASTV